MDILVIALIALALLTFFSTRRQRQELRKTQELQASLAVGDEVMTTSGMYGTVVGLTDDTADLEVAYEVVTTWNRAVIREKIAQPTEEDASLEVAPSSEVDETRTDADPVGRDADSERETGATPNLRKD